MKNSAIKDAITIVKKELARFFGDKRMVVTTIVMPGLMIYVMYTLMGSFMMDAFMHDEEYVGKAYVEYMPDELSERLQQLPLEWKRLEAGEEREDIKHKIQEKEVDLLVVFP
ncbi:MAG: ABC transporter permease, partial [Lachnospiraceae bacterium]|nr:ABC transporter permease [Lachnospiraceae bacterium]